MASRGSSTGPPLALWLVAAVVALLRGLPWVWSHYASAPDGSMLLHVGYIPKDFLQYLAFLGEAAAHDGWLLANPFTTQPQDPRFLAPLLVLLGKAAGALDVSPSLALELSRIPLVFAFFAMLWWFLAAFFPERAMRLRVAVLIGLSGGIEVLAKPLSAALPPKLEVTFAHATWQMSGWTTFAAAFNPLWLAGGIGVLAALRLVLSAPDDAAPPPARSRAALAAIVVALFGVHPYSAVALLAILAAQPVVLAALGEPLALRRWASIGLALLPALAVIAAVSWWQNQDAVYRAAAANALGNQQLSPFWYPIVFGGLFVLALRGARHWATGDHPLRLPLFAWLLTVVLLHSSSLLNGYHFASQLHVPLCLLAAPAFEETLASARAGALGARALLAVTFAAPLLLTVEALHDVPVSHSVPAEYQALLTDLERRAPGNALTSAKLGNVVPAFTQQRVYVGHHFLTPDYREKRDEVRELTSDPARRSELLALVAREDIRYVVLPTETAGPGLAALAPLARDRVEYGRLTLLELAPR